MSDILNFLLPNECYELSNQDCKNINKAREQARTETTTIEVGLQLPNANNPKEFVRFVPRYVTFITKS